MTYEAITGIYHLPQFMLDEWEKDRVKIAENKRINDEVRAYFEALGYSVGWDHSFKHGFWHEIFDSEGLVAQIDRDVPLSDIIEDFTANAAGKSGTSKSDYTTCGSGPRYKAMLARVAANQRGGIQETLPL